MTQQVVGCAHAVLGRCSVGGEQLPDPLPHCGRALAVGSPWRRSGGCETGEIERREQTKGRALSVLRRLGLPMVASGFAGSVGGAFAVVGAVALKKQRRCCGHRGAGPSCVLVSSARVRLHLPQAAPQALHRSFGRWQPRHVCRFAGIAKTSACPGPERRPVRSCSEWEPHRFTYLGWPSETLQGEAIRREGFEFFSERQYAELEHLVALAACREPVHVVVGSNDAAGCRRRLGSVPGVSFLELDHVNWPDVCPRLHSCFLGRRTN